MADPQEVQEQLQEREQRILDLDDTLADFGVHAGNAEARRELAEELEHDGMSRQDLDLIGANAEAEADPAASAPKLLRWRLADPERWRPLLEDLRRAEASRSARAVAPGPPTPEPGQVDRAVDTDRRQRGRASSPEDIRESELDRELLAVWRGDLGGDPDRVREAAKRLDVPIDRAVTGIGRQLRREGIEGGIDGWVAQRDQRRKRAKAARKRAVQP